MKWLMQMKRLILPVLLVVALLTAGGLYWTTSTAASREYTPSGSGDIYLGLGDSLAAGYSASVGQGYVDRLGARLQQTKPALVIQNIAVPGETTSSFNARQLPRALQFIKQQRAAGKIVSPITLTIGANDARAVERRSVEERRQMLERVGKNLGTALDQLLEATRGSGGRRTADIAVMTYYNPWSGDPNDITRPAYWSAELNRVITETARARGVPVADVATPFDGGQAYVWTRITAGDIHANNRGHEVIADQFWKALQYP